MKNILWMLLGSVFLLGCGTRNESLFLIYDSGRYGYIDSKGNVVVKPVFLNAGEFSEGLAPVRLEGKFGYIDRSGHFVIEPQFDYAVPFSDSLARVYLDGKLRFMDHTGHFPFDFPCSDAQDFSHGRAMVGTGSNRCGIIDKSGALLVDTLYGRIEKFYRGTALITGEHHDRYSENGPFEVGLIDTLGRFVVPFGRYEDIKSYSGGFYQVTLVDGDSLSSEQGFIDPSGKLVYRMKFHEEGWISSGVSDGLFEVLFEKKNVSSEFSGESYYHVLMNFKGEMFIPDSTAQNLKDVYHGRGIVIDRNSDYQMIDKNGRKVGRKWEFMERFDDGRIFVREHGVYGLIDSAGTVILEPKFEQVHEFPNDTYFAFQEKSGPDSAAVYRYGIADAKGNFVVKPILENCDGSGFHNGLIRTTIDGRMAYFNRSGKEIWRSSSTIKPPYAMNIDYMQRGYFTALSSHVDSSEMDEGHLGNFPRQIQPDRKVPDGRLSVIVIPETKDMVLEDFRAHQVWVCNTTKSPITFAAQDTRLDMKIQAKLPGGIWRDIEYLPNSWCGNSYHTLTLLPDEFWDLKALAYEGEFRATMRIELSYIVGKDRDGRKLKQVVYSNEYPGSVNPGQFWRKREYFPANIMDPYNQ